MFDFTNRVTAACCWEQLAAAAAAAALVRLSFFFVFVRYRLDVHVVSVSYTHLTLPTIYSV